ncbi:hypothetical protein LZ086_17925 [Acinetobacter johnsonii]|nr:hypothetical protein LZ086_17925 [Acinetobacter johnsonii]
MSLIHILVIEDNDYNTHLKLKDFFSKDMIDFVRISNDAYILQHINYELKTFINDLDDLVGNDSHVFIAPLMFDGEDWEIKGANQNGVADHLIDMKKQLLKYMKDNQ